MYTATTVAGETWLKKEGSNIIYPEFGIYSADQANPLILLINPVDGKESYEDGEVSEPFWQYLDLYEENEVWNKCGTDDTKHWADCNGISTRQVVEYIKPTKPHLLATNLISECKEAFIRFKKQLSNNLNEILEPVFKAGYMSAMMGKETTERARILKIIEDRINQINTMQDAFPMMDCASLVNELELIKQAIQ